MKKNNYAGYGHSALLRFRKSGAGRVSNVFRRWDHNVEIAQPIDCKEF